MTLQDFQNQIDSTILKKGKEYFHNEQVEFLEEIKKGRWIANVSGSEDYNVEIQIGTKQSIKKHLCDCPYDYGDVCKHIVAVLYAIVEENTIEVPKSTAKESTQKTKKPSFDVFLSKIELKEYQDFIKQYSRINKSFKDEFELYFSEKDESFDLEKKYVDIIKKTIKKHTSRGYIDYSASNKLGKELNQYLDTAKQYFSKNNYRDATLLYKIIIKEVSPVFEYCNDSNGYIADCVEVAMDELSEMIKAPVSFAFKETIADFLKQEVQKKIYFDYGNFGYNLTQIYASVCININKTGDFIEFIEAKIQSVNKSDYNRQFFIETKISFLSEIGRSDEVQQLIQQNLEIPEIRNLEINKMVEKKDFETAKKLIEEGIKIAEAKNHSGTVFQFEKKLLAIAVLEKDIKSERYFSRKFAFSQTLDTNYYNQWKNTFSKEEWTSVIEEVILGITKKINGTVQKNMFYANSLNTNLLYRLGPIYIQEGYWDRLLLLVQKQENLATILSYYSHLKKIYPDELLNLLIPMLEKQCDRCDGRSQYRDLAKTIKSIINDFPDKKERIIAVVQKLKNKYPRRPAMQEEFSKLF